ncbi:MAG TPA: carboxypeptidase-like regulatory domain-containing protein [Longimicrobium sp.]|jgi:hypothetical protein|uniref:carboxypeptidase-like regulatory domain-containing protein n=1 Tax=Longimicrobium sp. TaxID=2029185 RepID=UPI002ED956CC
MNHHQVAAPAAQAPSRRVAPLALKCALLPALLAVTLAGAACTESADSNPGTGPGQPSSTPTAFVATGQVLDSKGAPVPGVQVNADNVLVYNSNVQGTTDAQGRYRITLPNDATSWRMSASITRTVDGEQIRFDMHPGNNAAFPGVDGGVRNFQWKLSGERPEGAGVYGNSVWFYGNPNADFRFNDRDLEYTLEPVGPLADGTAGQTITRTGVNTGSGWGVGDVPFGRYRMSVRHVPTGRALRVRLRDTGTYAASVEGTFRSLHGGGTRPYVIEVEVAP